MLTSVSAQQRARSIEARRLLQPAPVRLHHVPQWFRLALLRHYGPAPGGLTDGVSLLQHAVGNHADWLDHWGSIRPEDDGQEYFVSEPYGLTADSLAQAEALAAAIGCQCTLTPNSWHYPGMTSRLVFWRPGSDHA